MGAHGLNGKAQAGGSAAEALGTDAQRIDLLQHFIFQLCIVGVGIVGIQRTHNGLLGKERGFIWLDDNRILFSAVRSAKEKKRAEAKEAFTSYYVLDLRGGEAQPFFTLPFGAQKIEKLDDTHFTVTTQVEISDQFFGWVLGLGKNVQILHPESVRKEMRDYIMQISEYYA